MRTVDEHLAVVLGQTRPLEPLDVSLLDARGCLLADPVTAPWPLPPFDSAACEGYAVASADVATASQQQPALLTVVDDVPAGYRATRPLGGGQAIRIGSGAPMPEGADAVVPMELTDAGMPTVSVRHPVAVAAHIRHAGDDLKIGQVVVEAGATIGAREVALLAAVGRARVGVRPRPRVVVISTGSELVEPGQAMTPGLLADSTGYMLTAAAQDAGAIAYRAGPVQDEERALTDTLEDQLVRADLVVTTGGVTASTYDTLKLVLERLGEVQYTRIAMTPDAPQGFGRLGPDHIPIFALPGSPTRAFVAFEVFVRPVIQRLLGRPRVFRETVEARLTLPVSGRAGLRRYLPARFDHGAEGLQITAIPLPGLQGLRLADALIVVPEGAGELAAGDQVTALPLGTP